MTVTASVREITGSSSEKTGCSKERPFYAVLELTTEMRKPTLDKEMGFQRKSRFWQYESNAAAGSSTALPEDSTAVSRFLSQEGKMSSLERGRASNLLMQYVKYILTVQRRLFT